jgi:hypothetical protein
MNRFCVYAFIVACAVLVWTVGATLIVFWIT